MSRDISNDEILQSLIPARFAVFHGLRSLLFGIQSQQLLETRSPGYPRPILCKNLVSPIQKPIDRRHAVEFPDPPQSHQVVGHLENGHALVHRSVVLDRVNGCHAGVVVDSAVGRIGFVKVVFQVRQFQFPVVGTVQASVTGHQPIHFELADIAFRIVQHVDLFRKQSRRSRGVIADRSNVGTGCIHRRREQMRRRESVSRTLLGTA
mmetsp:Transcript_22320/g.52728  ORF Transcript_22320/g.52728 Transcript_22320/m.52728 type:complete len:207 (-) Transcript_22320:328-948(-)